MRSGHFGANSVGSKPQQRSDTHLGHISETEAVPEERTESEGKRNNISGSERLRLMTRTSPASETEAPSGGEDGSITNGDEGDAQICNETDAVPEERTESTTQVDVVNTGTYADPRSPNWETQRTKSRGRRD